MRINAVTTFCLLMVLSATTFVPTNQAVGQDNCVTYKLVPRTSFKTEPSVVTGMVNETVMKTEKVTSYKPIWTRETRQRTTVVMKPIVKTSERVERFLVRRPIIETNYRERKVEETSFETVTEYKEQRYLIEKPVVETQMREERVVVRKPVTSTVMQSEDITTFKPVTVSETGLVADSTVRNDLVLLTGRNRLRRLRPGYYVDPATGLTDYKRRGLHWVPEQTLAVQPTIETTLVPTEVRRTSYKPETVTVQRPLQVTRYVDQVETRKVPVQVETTSRKIETMRIPVEVKKPVIKVRTERVPFEEVKYREEVYERRVPVTETTFQRVERNEPYEVEVCKWVAETKEVRVPTTVTRRVEYSVDQLVPETTWMRVPVDAFGNIVAAPQVVARQSLPSTTYRIAAADRIRNAPIIRSNLKPIVDTSRRTTSFGDPTVVRKLSQSEAEQLLAQLESRSIAVPESSVTEPSTDTTDVKNRPSKLNSVLKPITDTVEVERRTVPIVDEDEDADESGEAGHTYPFRENGDVDESEQEEADSVPVVTAPEPTPIAGEPTPVIEEPKLIDVDIESSVDAEINERPDR